MPMIIPNTKLKMVMIGSGLMMNTIPVMAMALPMMKTIQSNIVFSSADDEDDPVEYRLFLDP